MNVDVDDLAVLVDRPVPVAPTARDLHVRLVYEPTVADHMPARPSRVREWRREALHPPKHRDVIDLDPTLEKELFDVAIRQPEPQIPAHRENDHLRRNEHETPELPVIELVRS